MKLAAIPLLKSASFHHWRVLALTFAITAPASAQWSTVPISNSDWLRDVQLGAGNLGWLVGENGRIMTTANNGATWTPQTSGTTQMLKAVRFSGSRGWTCGNLGTILTSTDLGVTWTPQTSSVVSSLNAIHAINSTTAYVAGAGGIILTTSNSGTTWTPQTSGLTTAINGIYFHGLNPGWAVGDGGKIITTTDSGATWTAQTSGVPVHLNSVYFVTATRGFAVGEAGWLLKTINGGATWTRTRIASLDLKRVFFLDENNGWIAASKGTVFSTMDGGVKWRAQRTPVQATLDSVFFADNSVGVAVGFNGAVVRYFLGSKLGNIILASVAKKGREPPALPETTFSSFGPAFVNSDGECLFEAKLTGKATTGGRLWGMFSTMSGSLATLLRSKDSLAGFGAGYEEAAAGRPVGPVINRPNSGLFRLPMTGKSTNGRNNLALIQDTGLAQSPILRKGAALPMPDTGEIASVVELLQSRDQDAVALSYTLRRDPTLGVTSKNDSGLLLLQNDGTPLHALARAEKSAFGSGTFGKFVGRAAAELGTQVIFGAAWIPDGATKGVSALFNTSLDGMTNSRVIAVGEEAPTLNGTRVRSLIAWTQSGGQALYRATFTGPGVKTAHNEGLWRGNTLLLQKGVTNVGGGLFAKRILRFWPVGSDRLIIQVQLGAPPGSSVTRFNNQALILRLADGTFHTLLRTGQTAPGIPEATLGSIQAVEVDPSNGGYAVLGSLRGVSTATNQALWTGANTATTTLLDNLWAPVAAVRKGGTYQTAVTTRTPISSLSLKPALERSGAGGRGLGRVHTSGVRTLFFINSPGKMTELVQFMISV